MGVMRSHEVEHFEEVLVVVEGGQRAPLLYRDPVRLIVSHRANVADGSLFISDRKTVLNSLN